MSLYPVISPRADIQGFYEALRDKGQSHNMAEILAFRQPPRPSKTNDQFMAGRRHNDQFNGSPLGEAYRQIAQAAGVNTHGKYYMPSLAASPGDPEAWVSDIDDAKRLVEKRNLNCEGLIEHKAVDFEQPDKPYEVAEDIVDSLLLNECAENHDLAHNKKKLADKRQELKQRASGSWGAG